MRRMRSVAGWLLLSALVAGCRGAGTPDYGQESALFLSAKRRQVWAVAPVINLSGQKSADPILQADLAYQQLQQVQGLTVIPVDVVAQVYEALGISQVQTLSEAIAVCEKLECDGLVVITVTAYDPYDPPKLGASLQLFLRDADSLRVSDPRGRPPTTAAVRQAAADSMVQVVGMFDAANGSVRAAAWRYAEGRSDPVGPLGPRQVLLEMDRYCGFVYHALIADLLNKPRLKRI